MENVAYVVDRQNIYADRFADRNYCSSLNDIHNSSKILKFQFVKIWFILRETRRNSTQRYKDTCYTAALLSMLGTS